MIINSITFYIIGILIIITCFFTVISKKIMHSILYSFFVFILIGFLFFALNAPFLGAIQIAIYGIALSILFAISINLTNYNEEKNQKQKIQPKLFISVTGISLLCYSLIMVLKESSKYEKLLNNSLILIPPDTTECISYELLKNNLISFELLGVYILIALIGISIFFSFKGGN